MRTGIFVYANSVEYTLRPEISAVIKYNGPGSSTEIATKEGTVTLTKGIYRLITDTPTELQVAGGVTGVCEIVAVVNNKDPWPDPPATFAKEFPDVSTEDLRAFLPAAFDGFDEPAQRVTG